MLNKARIAVLVSGGGTNLEALLDAQEAGALPHVEIVLVALQQSRSLRSGAGKTPRRACHVALSRKAAGRRRPFEAALMEALTQYRVDLVVLAGFLSILSADFVPSLAGPDRQRPSLPDPRLLREGVLRAEGP